MPFLSWTAKNLGTKPLSVHPRVITVIIIFHVCWVVTSYYGGGRRIDILSFTGKYIFLLWTLNLNYSTGSKTTVAKYDLVTRASPPNFFALAAVLG